MNPFENLSIIEVGVSLYIGKLCIDTVKQMFFKDSTQIAKNTIAITAMTVTMKHTTDSMTRLETKLDAVYGKLERVAKLEADMHTVHERLRLEETGL